MAQHQQNGHWHALWEDYGPKLLLFARQLTEARDDAEDIVQEAFVRYWRARENDPKLTPPLLFTMVRRSAIDQARKIQARQIREERAECLMQSEAFFESSLEEKERQEQLEQSLRQLPADQREVLVLKIWGELTFDEIGRTLEISPNTAASRYRYALQQLRGILTPSLL